MHQTRSLTARVRGLYRSPISVRHLPYMNDRNHKPVMGARSATSGRSVSRNVTPPSTLGTRTEPPFWSAVPMRWVTVLTAPNCHSAHGAVVALDEACTAPKLDRVPPDLGFMRS